MAAKRPPSHSASADGKDPAGHGITPMTTTATTTAAPTPLDPSRPVSGTTAADQEKALTEIHQSNPNGFSTARSSISVTRAEADFADLQREFTSISRAASHPRHNRHDGEKDLEKGTSGRKREYGTSSEEEEPFNLESALRVGLAARQEAGIRGKHIGVHWDNLTVKGLASGQNFVSTFPDAFVSFFDVITPVIRMLGFGPKGKEVNLLSNFRGVCKPGGMVLVLGKPGSGCTTFLRTIANQRSGYVGVEGEVLYGKFTAQEFEEQYRGEAVYNHEDDVHHATLTVEQTLGFALDTKIPGKLPAGFTRGVFKKRVIDMMLKMFNIEHTRHTAVGDAFIRGVSGGERKRVSIAEMMVTSASILSWDNSTRGLDASTALDFAKSLRVLTDLYRTSTFVSLYQASEKVYALFDKVLVIDGGRQVFYGDTKEARGYFEGLGFAERPRQTTPDYLTGCTDEFERAYAVGRSRENAPFDAESLEAAFKESTFAKELEEEMAEYKGEVLTDTETHEDFEVAVRESKRGAGANLSVYSVGFHLQVWALMKRQFARKLQDRLALFLSWVRSTVIAVVLGTLYWDLDRTSASAFSKGGLMFISMLFNAFQAFSELAGTMTGRPIVNKHKAYAFHRPSALWIAQILVDQVFSATQILVFSTIVYFMSNLVREAAAFFTFYLMILTGNIAMTLFFRIIGCVAPGFDSAVKFAVSIITFFVLTSGYLIQYQSQHDWLKWIFWINPLGLSLSGLLINEFSRITMTCTDDSLIPSGPGYEGIDHQVCTLPGSEGGTLDVVGDEYLRQGFSYDPSDLWRNWGIVMALIGFFLALNVVLGELVNYGSFGMSARVFQRPNKERTALNEAAEKKREQRRAAVVENQLLQNSTTTQEASTSPSTDHDSDLKIKSESVLTWENLNYDVPTPNGPLRLLNNISGYVKPGSLTALMGASGAGKTTLLDVLAARKSVGIISGDVFVDGTKPGKQFQRGTSYAEQLDLHDPTQTVRETLRFSADLRQPYSTSREEKYEYVEDIMALLEMEDIADCIIGYPEFGLTVEQRKRVTIGVELAARPELLLFLDEPTSGLDSQSAFNIVRFLKKLAAAGQAILCTIHQPNAALFENFDRLLLLEKGGRCVYFGDIGADAVVLRGYLERNGATVPEKDNVAEFMLDAIGAGSSPRIGGRDWGDVWDDSPELEVVKWEIERVTEVRLAVAKEKAGGGADAKVTKEREKEYASPIRHQIAVVLKRMKISYWRSPNYLFTRLFNHFVISLLTGLTYLNLDDSRTSIQYRVFIMFQVTVLPALILGQVEVMYHLKRTLFHREYLSKMYTPGVFALTMVLAETPYSILCAVLFFLPLYYLPGLQSTPSRAGFQFLNVLITELFSVTMGQVLAAWTPSAFISSQFDPFIMITFALFCGVTIPITIMPKGYYWLHELDPFTRLINGMVTTALEGLEVVCKPDELNVFVAPVDQTCAEYMAPFFQEGGAGYLVDGGNSTKLGGTCSYCAFGSGNEFYEVLGLSFEERWRDWGIFCAYVGSNLVLLWIGSRFLNYNKR